MKNINVTQSSMPSKEEYFKEIESIWENHWMTNMGEKHNQLESSLREYLSVPNISLFSNGHMALELVIQALNLTGEVITTPFTFASTTHAIVRNGLTPVFCDINETDYTIDVSKIEELITQNTSAIIPVHVYGNICEVEKIQKIADRHHLKVIYDAAHAFGITYKGVGVGNFGDASMFSFHATKVFNTIEGGAVCFRDEELGLQLYRLKNFGIRNEEVVDGVGANAKMNEFQAAMGLCNLRHIDDEITKRKKVYEKYIELLENCEGITLPKLQDKIENNYSYFPILIDENKFGITRDELYQKLKQVGINSRKYFYPLTSDFECYKGKVRAENLVISRKISNQVLTLPLYADLDLEEVNYICNIVLKLSE